MIVRRSAATSAEPPSLLLLRRRLGEHARQAAAHLVRHRERPLERLDPRLPRLRARRRARRGTPSFIQRGERGLEGTEQVFRSGRPRARHARLRAWKV